MCPTPTLRLRRPSLKGQLLRRAAHGGAYGGAAQRRESEPARRPARPLVDCTTRQVEVLAERFALLLHMTLSCALEDLPTSHAPLRVKGLAVADYVQGIDYRRIVTSLLRFRVAENPLDLTSLFAVVLVYLRMMKTRAAVPLLEQMVVWFDVPNVIYCVAFLSHVWLEDEALPLQEWHRLTEGVVRGVNLNKCVRNVLRILKYRLFVTPAQAGAARASLEYTSEYREDTGAARLAAVGARLAREQQFAPKDRTQRSRGSERSRGA